MAIVAVQPPARNLGGRKARLSPQDIKALAEGIRRGEWVGDGETVSNKGTAHQRAAAASRQVAKAHGISSLRRVWATPGGYAWGLGPKEGVAIDPAQRPKPKVAERYLPQPEIHEEFADLVDDDGHPEEDWS